MKKWGNTFFQLLKIGHFYNAVMPAQVGVQKEALHERSHSGSRGGGDLVRISEQGKTNQLRPPYSSTHATTPYTADSDN